MIAPRLRFRLPRLRRKEDPRRATGYRGYRGSGSLSWWAWLALGAGFLLAMWALWTACGAFPAVSTVFRRVARFCSNCIGFFTGLLPIPAAELLVAAVVIGPVWWLIRVLQRRDWPALWRGLCRLVCLGCAAAFLFVFLYGVHHTAPSLASQMGLEVTQYSTAQLEAFVTYTVEQANALAVQAPRDGEGTCDFGSFRQMSKQSRREYSRIKQEYAVFDRPQAGLVKRSFLGGRIMSWVDLAGFYCPWVAESTVSTDVVDSHIPFNIAHENAHALGIGPEAECNFAAWLVCKDSEDIRFAYSGWLLAYIHAGNALYAADYDAWARQYQTLCPEVHHDIAVLNESLKRFEDSKVNELGSAANDALIKATGQADGIRSYGKVVDLMLAYFSTMNE